MENTGNNASEAVAPFLKIGLFDRHDLADRPTSGDMRPWNQEEV